MRQMPYAFLLAFLLCVCAQKVNGQSHTLSVHYSDTSPVLDGHLDDLVWQEAEVIEDFQMQYPFDNKKALSKTQVRVIYTNSHLYIAAVCHDESKGKNIIRSLKRDFLFSQNDAFSFIVDPFGDAVSGYVFTVNAFGAQSDGIVELGGIKGAQLNWDAVWEAEVFRNKNESWWSVEMAIPFNSLRFDKKKEWPVNFARNDLRRNEISVWSPVPRGTNVTTLSQAGILTWEQALPKEGANIALIPYSALLAGHNYQTGKTSKIQPQIGGDAKISLSTSLALDLTINPDFSQAEVDRQVINLNRFELQYPEKRLFFLENNDLFANLGNSRVRPFFSRRIGGIGAVPVPILFGARLSGRLNDKWRIGLMNMQTEGRAMPSVQGQNYTVAVLQRSLLHGSNVTAFLTNQQGFTEFQIDTESFNRVGGLEFDFRSPDSRWSGKAFAHIAFTEGQLKNNTSINAKIRYRTAKFNCFFGIDAPQENYITRTGYVPHLYHKIIETEESVRIGYRQFRTNGYYRFFPKEGNYAVDYYGFSWRGNVFTDESFNYYEHDLSLTMSIKWLNQSQVSLSWGHFAPRLFFPFEIKGLHQAFRPGLYQGKGIKGKFETGFRSNFFGVVGIRYGGEYNGRKLSLEGELNYRKQPWGLFGIKVSQENLMDFPDDYGEAAFTLIGAKTEISFSRDLFLTTFLQYNTQLNNFNINSRFQWRIKALSDLFLTYTENYRADNINVKDRALVLKIRYRIAL